MTKASFLAFAIDASSNSERGEQPELVAVSAAKKLPPLPVDVPALPLGFLARPAVSKQLISHLLQVGSASTVVAQGM